MECNFLFSHPACFLSDHSVSVYYMLLSFLLDVRLCHSLYVMAVLQQGCFFPPFHLSCNVLLAGWNALSFLWGVFRVKKVDNFIVHPPSMDVANLNQGLCLPCVWNTI